MKVRPVPADIEARGLGGARVLVVDDEDAARRATARMLEAVGAEVWEASGGAEAIEAVSRDTFDVVLCDIVMPIIDGIAVLRTIRDRDLDTSVVLCTGAPGFASAVDALRLGAVDYVCKPASMKHVCESVGPTRSFGARTMRSPRRRPGSCWR